MNSRSSLHFFILLLIFPFTAVFSQPTTVLTEPLPSVLKKNDPLPSFTLCNQDHKTITEKDLLGKVTVMNFIFTRCCMPTLCPAVTKSMAQLQKIIRSHNLDNNVNFITLSFDPEFDTPDVLKCYAQAYNISFSNYSFLTGDPQSIKNLMQQFGVYVISKSGTINHSMRTLIIDKDGKIAYETSKKDWQPDTLLLEIKKILK